jgi:cell wall-associated NlpC family hydrolase
VLHQAVRTQPSRLAALTASALAAIAIAAPAAAFAGKKDDGGVRASYFPLPPGGVSDPGLGPQPGKSVTATLSADGQTAVPPSGAPAAVVRVMNAANRITTKPYRWGGGHRRFADSAYDCSGAVSFALRGAGLVPSPLDSRALMRWGQPGLGAWITVFASGRHAFMVVAGLRFDTSGPGGRGPRWRPLPRSAAGFTARHFAGL